MSTIFRKLIPALLLLALAFAALPAPSISAAGPEQPAQTRGGGSGPIRLIESKFKLEQRRYQRQSQATQRAEIWLKRVENIIARADAQGLDTSAVSAALQDYQQAAAALHEQAGELIEARPGFDANGKVTDAVTAAETVEQIHLLLDQARDNAAAERETLQHALWDLFQTMLKSKA